MEKTKSVLPLLLILILLVSLFYSDQKTGMFIDEIYTYGLSNGYYTPFVTDLLEEDHLLTRQEMQDYLTVSGEDAFALGSVYYNQTRDVHPPLHYWLIHIASSLTQGSWSKWVGILPNLALLMAACWMLYRLLKRSFGMEWLALAGTGLYGLSTIAISTAIMIRMYMLLTLLTVVLAYGVLGILQNPRRRDLFLVGGAMVLGLMTQYYFVFYAFFLCAACCLYLLCRRRWRDLARFAGCALGGVAVFCLVYPACFDHLFAEKLVSGGTMMEQLLDFGSYFRKLHTYVYSINFYARVPVRTGILGVLLFLPMAKRLFTRIRRGELPLYQAVISVPAFAALFVVAVASPVIPLRYAYNLIPIFVYAVCQVLFLAASVYDSKYRPVRIAKALIAPAAVLASLFFALRVTPEYLYPEHGDYNSAIRDHTEAPCIYFDDGYVSPLTQDLLQLVQFEEVYVTADPGSEELRDYLDAHPEGGRAVVYIDTDPEWSSGFDAEAILAGLEEATGYGGAQLLYAYGSSETYLLTKSTP